jgi:sulfate transport system ATP-binding protein
MSIEVASISKRFGNYLALDDVSLTIRRGEFVALLGPSGSGKTTLLRIIAGLEQPDSGEVSFDGLRATDRGPRERSVGFVFQHYALFRHMSVFDNIAFGLRVRPREFRPSPTDIRRRVEDLLRLVQLEPLARRYPTQLSGGQRQRVALARALAIEPKVLLLDEPFGALDAKVRKELRRWLRRLHEEMQITSVFVTHDQEEALEVADRVVVMGQGRIEQIDAPDALYHRPDNPFVCRFLGDVNEIAAEFRTGAARAHGLEIGEVLGEAPDGRGTLYVRPHDIDVRLDPTAPAAVRFVATVGATARLEVAIDHQPSSVEVEIPYRQLRDVGLAPGSRVRLFVRHGQVFKGHDLGTA